MTIHKSKGQEFDIVFMPGLSRSQFPHSADDPTLKRIKEEDRLVLALDRLRLKGKVPQDALERQKIEKIEEKARLLYVGFTRAKRALFCTTSTLQIRFKKEETIEPCLAFEVLRDYVAKNLPHALKSSSEDSGGEL
jgi:DNA helicase-2/ATP-dependent DNA helicase PcrA